MRQSIVGINSEVLAGFKEVEEEVEEEKESGGNEMEVMKNAIQ